MQSTSQTPVWPHCCIWRAMSWHGTVINWFWKHLIFGSQLLLMTGAKKASRPLTDSAGSLYRKPYFRILTKCLLKYVGMWFLKAVDFNFYYSFSCSPLTTGTTLWVGAVVCMCLDSHWEGQIISLLPQFEHIHYWWGLQQRPTVNCQSGLETVNQVYTNVEYLW